MLTWSELSKKPAGGAAAPPDLLLQLRLGKSVLRGAALQEEIVNQVWSGDIAVIWITYSRVRVDGGNCALIADTGSFGCAGVAVG